MEREVLLTGIGGQGVQLAAKVLALAATQEGREVMWLGTYGGSMRGGNTDATICPSATIRSKRPPDDLSETWSRNRDRTHEFAAPDREKIGPDGPMAWCPRWGTRGVAQPPVRRTSRPG